MKKLILLSLILIIIIAIIAFNNPKTTGNSIQQETIILPVKVHIILEETGSYTSSRNEENIRQLFSNANKILEQANIYLSIEEIVTTQVSFEAIPNSINGNYLELYNNRNLDESKLNAFMVQSLNGINGQALMNIDSITISDFTTVNDYRTLAHEVGHLLKLKHVPPYTSLMAQGKNGEFLSDEEIKTMRNEASTIF